MNILQLLGISSPGIVSDPNDLSGGPSAPAAPMASPDPLAALGDGTGSYAPSPSNFLQTLNGGANAQVSSAPAPAQLTATQPARSRSSLLDRIGRVADVIATVGGAHPLYQPTLDARQDRTLALGDHDRSVTGTLLNQQLTGQHITAGQGTIADAAAARVQRVAQAMQAIRAKNPQADMNSIFPLLAHQNGIPDDQIATISQEMANNPDLIDGLAGRQDLGKNLYSAEGPDGKKLLYQVGPDGVAHFLQMGSDVTPDALHPKVVNTGGSTVVLGDDGKPISTIGNTARPDTVLTTGTQRDIAAGRNSTAVQVAGIRAGATTDAARIRAGASGKKAGGDPFTSYSNGVHAISSLDQSLGDLINDPALTGATGLVGGHLRVTNGQRAIQGKIDSLTGQAIPAAIAAIKASGGASPRAVSEIMGEVKGLVGAIQNRDMATPDYIANVNAARSRLRQRVQDMTDDAVRQGFAVRNSNGRIAPVSAGSPAPAAAPASKPILPRNFTGRPGATQSQWGR